MTLLTTSLNVSIRRGRQTGELRNGSEDVSATRKSMLLVHITRQSVRHPTVNDYICRKGDYQAIKYFRVVVENTPNLDGLFSLLPLMSFFGANVGRAMQSSFGPLFSLRMLQSAGISGTYALAYGFLATSLPQLSEEGTRVLWPSYKQARKPSRRW